MLVHVYMCIMLLFLLVPARAANMTGVQGGAVQAAPECWAISSAGTYAALSSDSAQSFVRAIRWRSGKKGRLTAGVQGVFHSLPGVDLEAEGHEFNTVTYRAGT